MGIYDNSSDENSLKPLSYGEPDDDAATLFPGLRAKLEMLMRNNDVITKFLGKGTRCVEVYTTKWYYGRLLTWTVKRITSSTGWKTTSVHGFLYENPIWCDVPTDYT